MSDYDVIVIGSGAGGGTLVHRLAGSGKKILLLERGDFLTREPQNWRAEDVFVDGRYQSEDTWYDKEGQGVRRRRCTTSSAARPRCTARRSTACAPRTSARSSTQDGVSPAWPISYDEMEPYYTQAEQLYQVHGARGEDPTEPPASAPYPHPAVSHEPRIQQLSDDLAAAGYQPFHAPCGVMLDEENMPYSALRPLQDCDGFPCLVHAKSDAEVMAVRPALEHANVTLLTNATARRLETDADGTAVTEVVVERDGEARDLPRRHRRRSPAAPPTRPGCCSPPPATSTRTAWPTAPTRSGATTCSTTARPSSRSRRSRTRPSSRRRWASTTSISPARSSTTRSGNIQMVGKSQAPMFRGEKPLMAKLAPGWSPRGDRRATRSTSGSRPRTCRSRRTGSRSSDDGRVRLSYTHSNEEPKKELYDKLKSMLGHIGMHSGHLLPHDAYLKNEIPVAGVAHQAGTCRFGTDPGDLGARHELQGARARQPLRGGHQLLSEHRRGQPGAHRDGQLDQGRRPPVGAIGLLGARHSTAIPWRRIPIES